MATTLTLTLDSPSASAREFTLSSGGTVVGRSQGAGIVLPDSHVSRQHARIESTADGWRVTDLESANGTFVNEARVDKATLKPGDLIRIGESTLRVGGDAPAVEATMMMRLDSVAEADRTISQSALSVVLRDTSLPRLVVNDAGRTREHVLQGQTLTIGRGPECEIQLDQQKVSRQHARIEARGDSFVIKDLGSTNGILIGGARVLEHTLCDRDTVQVGDAFLIFKAGFDGAELDLAPHETMVGGPARRRPVVVVPGIAGSELWRGSERIWPNAKVLLTRPEILRLPEFQPLEARSILGEMVIVPNFVRLETYNRLGDFLEESLGYERGRDLIEFAFDWRHDIRASARLLAQTIDAWGVSPPITIIAHSLGCIVSRYYVERFGGKDKVERLVLIGGPNYGSPTPLSNLLVGPNLLPFGLLGDRMREMVATWPMMYQLLPIYTCAHDQEGRPLEVLNDEGWLEDWQRPFLKDARRFRRELGSQSSVPCVSIYGYGSDTPASATVQRDINGRWQKVDFVHDKHGDGTIQESSAMFKNSEIHPVEQNHGTLYVDNDVKRRLKAELQREERA